MIIIWQTVRRITNEILGVKGLKDKESRHSIAGWLEGMYSTAQK